MKEAKELIKIQKCYLLYKKVLENECLNFRRKLDALLQHQEFKVKSTIITNKFKMLFLMEQVFMIKLVSNR